MSYMYDDISLYMENYLSFEILRTGSPKSRVQYPVSIMQGYKTKLHYDIENLWDWNLDGYHNLWGFDTAIGQYVYFLCHIMSCCKGKWQYDQREVTRFV